MELRCNNVGYSRKSKCITIAPRRSNESIEERSKIIEFGSFDDDFRYTSPPASFEIDRATVVLAAPPSSYVGVKDIVDLAVARGGDTKLLESLTSINYDDHSKTRAVLIEQLTTLKYALTRPNVQFLIYEVHTVLPSETTKMVEQVVDYVNRMATEKYIRECLVSIFPFVCCCCCLFIYFFFMFLSNPIIVSHVFYPPEVIFTIKYFYRSQFSRRGKAYH